MQRASPEAPEATPIDVVSPSASQASGTQPRYSLRSLSKALSTQVDAHDAAGLEGTAAAPGPQLCASDCQIGVLPWNADSVSLEDHGGDSHHALYHARALTNLLDTACRLLQTPRERRLELPEEWPVAASVCGHM